MEDNIIYIAGSPDAYPLEYYDKDSQSYQGVIPELLRRFSEQSQYDVRYYQPEKGDQRAALAVNRQVDIISCPDGPLEVPHQRGADILLFEDSGNGQAAVLRILNAAPQSLADDLQAFLSGVGQQERTALVLQTAQTFPPADLWAVRYMVGGLALTALLLAFVLVRTIVTSRRRLARLRSEHETDPATGLGNRVWLARRCQAEINDRNRVLYTMFCFSLASPAPAGSAALPEQIAGVLKDCVSGPDLLARVSDTCFAVLRRSAGSAEISEWAASVLGRLRDGLRQAGRDPRMVTAGVCPLKAGDQDLDTLLTRAGYSAQQARQTQSGWQLFGDDTLRAVRQQERLQADARHALENQEFQIYIQFYVSAFTGRALGGEVMLFWEHPEQGILPPERFLPLLEQEGLCAQLDTYVLERIGSVLENLNQQGRPDFFLLYGVSEQTWRAPDLQERWAQIAEAYPNGRRQMFLGVPLCALKSGAENLRAVQSLEMGLLLNDFDGQLAAMAPGPDISLCGVKLDSAFSAPQQPEALLRAAVQAGHALGLSVLAGGADTEEAAVRLRQQGCDFLRGALYARPLPLWEAMRMLMDHAKGKETGGE